MTSDPATSPSTSAAATQVSDEICIASLAFLDAMKNHCPEDEQMLHIKEFLTDWLRRLENKDAGKRCLVDFTDNIWSLANTDMQIQVPPESNPPESNPPESSAYPQISTLSSPPETSAAAMESQPSIPAPSTTTSSAAAIADNLVTPVNVDNAVAQGSTIASNVLSPPAAVRGSPTTLPPSGLRRSNRLADKPDDHNAADDMSAQNSKRNAQTQKTLRSPPKKKPRGRPPRSTIETLSIQYKLAPDATDPKPLDEVFKLIKRQLEAEGLTDSTFKNAIEVALDMHTPETFQRLSRSFRRLLAECPNRDPARRDKPLQNCPRPFYDFIFIYEKTLSRRCAESDNYGIINTLDDLNLLDSWNNLKYTYENEDATGHDWLVDEVKRLKKHRRPNAGVRDISRLKDLIGVYMGFDLNQETDAVDASEATRKTTSAGVQFNSDIQQAKCIKAAIDSFGYGVLPLIKPWQVKHVPVKILSYIFATLSEMRPSVKALCDILDKVYVTPMKYDYCIQPSTCERFLEVSAFGKFTGIISELFSISDENNPSDVASSDVD